MLDTSRNDLPSAACAPAAPRPVIVNWNLSLRCNFYCDHCYSRTERYRDLDTEGAMRVVDRFRQIGILSINIGGGEPFMRRDLLEVTAYAAAQGLRVSLSSNGSLIDADTARRAKAAGVRKIELSIDSADADTHDTFRRHPGAFAGVVAAAGHLREAGVPIDVSTVICRINVHDFERVITLARTLGARKISLQNYKCSGLGDLNKERLDLQPHEWRAFYVRALEAKAAHTDIEVTLSDPILHALEEAGCAPEGEDSPLVRGCACGTLTMAVKPNGDITPCAFIPLTIGNILDDGFGELWQASDVLHQMRHRQPGGKCNTCPVQQLCTGGCPSRAYSASGGFDVPDPHCWRPD